MRKHEFGHIARKWKRQQALGKGASELGKVYMRKMDKNINSGEKDGDNAHKVPDGAKNTMGAMISGSHLRAAGRTHIKMTRKELLERLTYRSAET